MSNESVSQQAKRRGFGVIKGGKDAAPDPQKSVKARAQETQEARKMLLGPQGAPPTAKQAMQQRQAARAEKAAENPGMKPSVSVRKQAEAAKSSAPAPGVILEGPPMQQMPASAPVEELPAAPPTVEEPPPERILPPPPPAPRRVAREHEAQAQEVSEPNSTRNAGSTQDEYEAYLEENKATTFVAEDPGGTGGAAGEAPASGGGSGGILLLVGVAAVAWLFFRSGGSSVAGLDEVDVTPGRMPLPELPPVAPGAYHDVVIDDPDVFASPKPKKKKRSR